MGRWQYVGEEESWEIWSSLDAGAGLVDECGMKKRKVRRGRVRKK
jgi:hypothetical protein